MSILNRMLSPEAAGALTAKVEFRFGISLELKYMTRERLRALYLKCTEHKWNHQTHNRQDTLNEPKFLEELVKAAVSNWDGVTLASASNIVPMQLMPEDDLEAPLPFDMPTMIKLVQSSNELSQFVQNTVADVTVFRPSLPDEVKN